MKLLKKNISLLLAIAMVLGSIIPGIDLVTKASAQEEKRIVIHNPYKDVDWEKYGQYKANFHSHTTESDGGNKPAEMIEEHYRQGYDVVAMTDHNFIFTEIDRTDTGKEYVTSERRAELEAGVGRDGRKITFIPHSDEQSRHDHVNTFWTDYNNPTIGASMEESIKQAEQLGGISHINHPGRYTGGRNTKNNGADGEAASNNPKNIQKYLNLFNKYNSLVGMEIINKKDGDSYSDRILWDNLLKETMPNRPIWGFSNDDNHSIAATGFSYNMLLMPENNETEIRKAMEEGSFYAIARVSKRELGNSFVGTGEVPKISDITVNGSEISITNENVNKVQWIADGKVISEGNSIDLSKYTSEVNGYVRANLIGPGGIAFTQPFGIEVEQKDIDITFNPNGGRLEMGIDFNASLIISKDEHPQVLPENAFTEGYTRATKEVNGKEVELLGWKIEGTDEVLTEEDLKTYEFKEDTTLIAQWKEEATKYPPVAEKINKVVGEKVTEEEVLDAVTVPNYPEDKEEPTKKLKYDARNLPDGTKEEGFTAYVIVTYPDGTIAEAQVEINITKAPAEQKDIDITFNPNGGRLEMGIDFNASLIISKDEHPQVLPESAFTEGYTRATKEVNGKEVEFLGWKIEETDEVLTEEDLKTYEFKEDTTLIAQWKEEATKYPPVAEEINKVVGEKVTEEEVLEAVTVPNYPEDKEEPTKKLKYDARNLPDGTKDEGFTAYVIVTYPDGSTAEAQVEINITKGEDPTKPPVRQEEIRVTFDIKDKDQDVAEFEKDEHGGIYITFVYAKGKDASEVKAQAPKVNVKDGYEFKGWTPEFEGKLNEDTVYTAVIKKMERETPEEPSEPNEPNEPSNPSEPSTPGVPTNPTKPSEETQENKIETDRVKGRDRIETAVEISKKYFKQADTVIVVDASNFPDAMAASTLAKQLKAPILLTNSKELDSRVAKEIERLGAQNVIVVGGNSSVSEGTLNQLSKFDKDEVERISGKDRYETSAEVARRLVKLNGNTGQAVIASGQVFADALTVGPYAAREGYPILLVKANNLPKAIKDAIKDLEINKVTIAGGNSSVSKKLESSLPTVVERLSGPTRYETAIDIANKKFSKSKEIFLANGEHWMDALVIGPVGGILDMPILLTGANNAPQSLKDYIAKSKIEKITAIGGRSMVSDKVLNELSK